MTPLPTNGPRRVSVNSFGYGGTNAHVILEEAPASIKPLQATDAQDPPEVKATSYANGNQNLGNGFHSAHPTSNGHSKLKMREDVENMVGSNGNGSIKTESESASESESSQSEIENGGTKRLNGHTVTNGNQNDGDGSKDKPQLFILSARSEKTVQEMVENLRKWTIEHEGDPSSFIDVAHTLRNRRTPMQFRFSTVASNSAELVTSLNQKPRITKSTTNFRSIFLFTGQGAQWATMGRELTLLHPVFRSSMQKSDKILRELGSGWSLTDELSKEAESSKVGEAEISQPSTTAIQIALVDLLQSYNVLPDIVLGHSSGEIAAAYAAGILDHKTALEVSYHRGFMSQASKRAISSKGAMMAVGLGEDDVGQYIAQTRSGLVSVACVNSPVSTTISGDESAIDELKIILDDASIFNRKLKVDTAYHSYHMKKVASQYLQSIAHIQAGQPKPWVKFYSSVDAAEKTANFDANYWVENLVSTVRFSNALDLVCRTELSSVEVAGAVPLNIFVEIGPHSALAGPVRQIIQKVGKDKINSNYVSTLVRGRNAVVTMLETAGKLFELGYQVSLDKITYKNDGSRTPATVGNLDPYPWDHSSSYWIESNLSKLHRFRAHPPHDLLGLRIPGTTNHEPAWRNLIGIDTHPWLRDHVVDGFIIYPGAAYLCMVIEAVRQISVDRQISGDISRILFKNISFSKAIVIPERRPDGLTPDVEILLTLRPERSLTDRSWESFRIMALSSDNVHSEHCSGSVMIEFTPKVDEVEGFREDEMTASSQLQRLQSMKIACDTEYTGDELYKSFAANGNVFGPMFSNIKHAQVGSHVAVSSVTLPDVSSVMPRKYQQPHLIHPASFDAISHLGMPLYRRNSGNGPVMPTGMDEVIINCKLSNKPGTRWTVATTMHSEGPRSAIMDTMVFEEAEDGSLTPIMDIRGGALRGIGEAASEENTYPFHRRMSYRIKWQPDVDCLSKAEIENLSGKTEHILTCEANDSEVTNNNALPTQKFSISEEMELYELAASIYIHELLIDGKFKDIEIMKPHLRKLLLWMEKYSDSQRCQDLIGSLSEDEKRTILRRASVIGIEGQMLTRIGENLRSILSGDIDSLSIMLEDNLLSRFYAEGLIVPNYLQMVEYLKLLAFKNPHMNILEIGAGTGGATLPLIQSLDREEGVLFNRYHYTDISAGFFEQGKTLLGQWADRIDFKTLDISKDPVQQGFTEAAYDFVIASNVLHATAVLDQTIANSRKLLKPGGRLVLIELTRLTAHINLIFGTLAGWWASEDGREDCPLLSKDQWDSTLKQHGFNGLEVATPDHKSTTARSFMMVSKVLETEENIISSFPPVFIICQDQSPSHHMLAGSISTHLTKLGFSCTISTWATVPVELKSIYIVLDDISQPVLMEPANDTFHQVVDIVTKVKNVLWLSWQESMTEFTNPVKGLVTGLARVVRRENEGMRFITLDVQQSIASPDALISAMSNIIAKTFPTPIKASKSYEDEYIFRNNDVLIPRISADIKFENWVKKSTFGQSVEDGIFQQPDRPLKLEVETPGLLNSLRFVDDDLPFKDIGPFEIELEARAHGINFKDVFIAMGQMVPGVTMAGECAGIVRKVGSALIDKFAIGDRVCGIGAEPFSSYPRVNGHFSYQIPDSMTYAVGASIPVIFTTAYYCVVEAARLQAGQTILIHAASGGVGQAAIQIAQNIGAEIFCTVGSSLKRQLLIDHFNIPPSHIFSSRLRTFKQGIFRLTKNKGVDCVLNSLSGEWLHDSFAVLAPLGTFVEIGKADIYRKNQISMIPFDKNVTFAAVDLTVLARLKPVEMRDRLGKVLAMFKAGVLRPVVPIMAMPMTDIEEAFRLIQSRKHTGKVVVVCDDDTRVKMTSPKPKPLRLHQDGTYLIAGGLGDLGRRIAKFLAAHGAGNIVTLSRRKLEEQDQATLESEIRSLGAKLHIATCDITDKNRVLEVAAECAANLPPVRGIIHGGMVLRVSFSYGYPIRS